MTLSPDAGAKRQRPLTVPFFSLSSSSFSMALSMLAATSALSSLRTSRRSTFLGSGTSFFLRSGERRRPSAAARHTLQAVHTVTDRQL